MDTLFLNVDVSSHMCFLFFRRQLLERDHSLRAAHDAHLFGALHHQQIQQQEEALLRLQGKTPRP